MTTSPYSIKVTFHNLHTITSPIKYATTEKDAKEFFNSMVDDLTFNQKKIPFFRLGNHIIPVDQILYLTLENTPDSTQEKTPIHPPESRRNYSITHPTPGSRIYNAVYPGGTPVRLAYAHQKDIDNGFRDFRSYTLTPNGPTRRRDYDGDWYEEIPTN